MPRDAIQGNALPLLLLAALFGLGCSVAPPIRSTEIANQSDATIEVDLTGKDRGENVHATLRPGSAVRISGTYSSGEIRSGDRVLIRIKPFESTYTVKGPAGQQTVSLD